MSDIYIATMIYINLKTKKERLIYMRIVWKDSKPKGYKPVKYRNHMIYGSPKGWTTTIPGDDNLYASHYCALNAIDNHLGGYGQMGTAKRKAYGIQIIGKKDGELA